jgi:hypothetical protein
MLPQVPVVAEGLEVLVLRFLHPEEPTPGAVEAVEVVPIPI